MKNNKVIYYKNILASLRVKELAALENDVPINKKLKKQLEKLSQWYIVDLVKENSKNKNKITGGKQC